MYEQENVRSNEPPKYSRLKTIVRRHIDQTLRIGNFRALNEMVEGGAVTKSRKGREVSVERKVGARSQWKAIGQCAKGDSCSFSHDGVSGNRCDQRQKGESSSPAQKAQTQSDGKKPSKGAGFRGESPSGTGGKIPCRNVLRGKLTNPSCHYWHPPVCPYHKSESGCTCGDKCRFRHVEAVWQPSEKTKKSGVKRISCFIFGIKTFGLCVSRFSSEKICSMGKREQLGPNHMVDFSKGTWVAPHNNLGKAGSITRSYSKVLTSRAQSVCAEI